MLIGDELNLREMQIDTAHLLPGSEAGTLFIDAGNGNGLLLNARTGDMNTFNVTIAQQGQQPETITEQ